jgi:hypothetical protein
VVERDEAAHQNEITTRAQKSLAAALNIDDDEHGLAGATDGNDSRPCATAVHGGFR